MPVLCNNVPKMVGLPVVFAVEVGCLGYVSPSLFHCLESLGIPSATSRKLRNECSRVAHRCSYVLFLCRSCVDWTSWSMGWPSTFLKLALVLLAVLIWQLAFLLVCPFPFPKLALLCPLPQQCLLCVHFCFFLWACPPSPRWSLSRLDLNPHAQSWNFFTCTMRMRISPSKSNGQSRIFSQCACVFHCRMDVACVHTCTWSHSSWLKLKVLVTKGVLGFARGLTSSDALICCQVLVLILMVDETDPARSLIRSWWRIRNWWWWWSSSEVFYCTVVLWRITFDVLVWQFHHTTTTILLSVVTVVEFASRWQMVFYTGSASHVVLSAGMSVSLRSSMHIKIDMAFLVVLRLVHPICFFSSFATWLSSLSFHTCVLACDPTRSVARA